jgi:hypothetical protein
MKTASYLEGREIPDGTSSLLRAPPTQKLRVNIRSRNGRRKSSVITFTLTREV